jgi:hypothetical protein
MPHTNDASPASSGSNGQSTIGEAIYALTDEQILDIDDAEVAPPPRDAGTQQGVILSEGGASASSGQAGKDQRPGISASRDDSTGPAVSDRDSERGNRAVDSSGPSAPQNDTQTRPAHESPATGHQSPITSHESPPEWLAQAMNDPQQGGPARQFWESAQQTRAQAAQLASLDRAYFGAPGVPPAQLAESREALAQQLLHEDPAAFREMLAAGLRALQQQGVTLDEGRAVAHESPVYPEERGVTSHQSPVTSHEALVTHYAAFERAANDDLDRAVRPEIARVIERALPAGNNEPARATQERLSGLVRTEIETALRQDRALGEQVAQLLRSRTFDDATRAQVVRLIAARATSLVPVASRRVLSEWTQSALAAHRAQRSLAGATDAARNPSSSPDAAASPASSAAKPRPAQTAAPGTQHAGSRRINYRALSDEEILDL